MLIVANTTIISDINGPSGIAIDNDGNIIVTEYNAGNVKKYSADGTLISTNHFWIE
ncbi:hypothetical protein [Clostridium beijerinckii]|uniref:hypothetical protein n=1 Tax=Clostridium beijerinckii TaxID=1520 RepID=UPI00156D68A5|nr:uncharacterized protein YjiK [Clostridium beijerinckii]